MMFLTKFVIPEGVSSKVLPALATDSETEAAAEMVDNFAEVSFLDLFLFSPVAGGVSSSSSSPSFSSRGFSLSSS